MEFFAHYNYWITIALMMLALYIVIARGNLVKKIVGLGMLQTAVFLLYITIGTVSEGAAPILKDGVEVYSNPLPHVLILTAIVVALSTTALALALAVRIKKAYGTVEEDEIRLKDEEREAR